jgi:hypothetical protein
MVKLTIQAEGMKRRHNRYGGSKRETLRPWSGLERAGLA